jgi:hypothetical protein
MILTPGLTLSVFAMLSVLPQLKERALEDVAVIGIPRGIKDQMYKGLRDDQAGRLTFTFATSYFWASIGSSTAYRQQIFVSYMAPDASDAEYAAMPRNMSLSYDPRTKVSTSTIGSGTLTITEGLYRQNTLAEPSYTFFYVDRKRRLQIYWHTAKTETDLAQGTELIGKMAASFRVKREPTAEFAAMRDRPRKDAEEAARKRALALEMLNREGYGAAEPGKPVFRNDVYVERMTDPEPRFQLVVPLGRVRIDPATPRWSRPRPVRLTNPDGTSKHLPGSVGWREFIDDTWEMSNQDNAYLPMSGIGAALAAKGNDPAFVTFYYTATVRIEEESDDTRLTNLRWFFDSVPEVRRLWQEGKLVKGGTPERD